MKKTLDPMQTVDPFADDYYNIQVNQTNSQTNKLTANKFANLGHPNGPENTSFSGLRVLDHLGLTPIYIQLHC